MITREFLDAQGDRWIARVISGGRSSEYLNERVQRPIVQFDRADGQGAARYSMLGHTLPGSLAEVSDADLRGLLGRSRPH